MKLEQSGQMFLPRRPSCNRRGGGGTRGECGASPSIQSYGTGVETKIVFGAAVKVDLQSGKTRGARDGQRVVLFPEDGRRPDEQICGLSRSARNYFRDSRKAIKRSKVFVLYVDRLHSFVDHRFRGLSQNAAQPSGVVFLSNAEQSRCRRRSA